MSLLGRKTAEELLEDEEYQYGRELLWKLKEYEHYLNQGQKTLLQEFKAKLEKYQTFSPGRKSLLLTILNEVRQVKEQKDAEKEAASKLCYYCGNLGFIPAVKIKDPSRGCKFTFKCNCNAADLKRFNWPRWENHHVHHYEPEYYGTEESTPEEVAYYKDIVLNWGRALGIVIPADAIEPVHTTPADESFDPDDFEVLKY